MKTTMTFLAATLASAGALGQTFQYAAPAAGDRWMYPFNFSNGFETTAPTFGAILQPGFDDRDSQMLVIWNTSGVVPSRRGEDTYHVSRVVVRATVANDMVWRYDGTADPTASSYPTSDPEYVADTDAGRPVELFGVGFRNAATRGTWTETSPFSTGTPNPAPAENWRDVFAAITDGGGTAIDVSNQVRARLNPSAMAIGSATGIAAGTLVPAGTEIEFEVNLCDPTTRLYFAKALDGGKLVLSLSTLEPATGGPGGGSGGEYPRFYAKEHPDAVAQPTKRVSIEIDVRLGRKVDVNGDTLIDILDFLDFIGAFADGDPFADYDGNCEVDILDFLDFIDDFSGE